MMAFYFAAVKIFRFWSKTMDYIRRFDQIPFPLITPHRNALLSSNLRYSAALEVPFHVASYIVLCWGQSFQNLAKNHGL